MARGREQRVNTSGVPVVLVIPAVHGVVVHGYLQYPIPLDTTCSMSMKSSIVDALVPARRGRPGPARGMRREARQ